MSDFFTEETNPEVINAALGQTSFEEEADPSVAKMALKAAGEKVTYGPELTEALKKSGLFPSATSAIATGKYNDIRRKESGDWELPSMAMSTKDGGMRQFTETLGAGIDQFFGGKERDTLLTDPQPIQKVFHEFQQANNLSDEDMNAAWNDFWRMTKPWDKDEKVRLFSDGRIRLNPLNREYFDDQKVEDALTNAGVTEEAKQEFKAGLRDNRYQVAADKLHAYEAAANVSGSTLGRSPFADITSGKLQSPSGYANLKGYSPAVLSTPEFLKEYEDEVIDKQGTVGKWARGLAVDAVLGFNKLATTGLGLGGLMGNEAMAQAGMAGSEAGGVVSQGKTDTGIAGSIVQELPSVTAQVVASQLTGGLSLGLVRGVATPVVGKAAAGVLTEAATGAVGMTTTLATAGAQSAAMSYVEMRAQGATDEEARNKSIKAGLNTAIITGVFQGLGAGGVERAGNVASKGAEVALRDIITAGTKQEVWKATRGFVAQVLKDSVGEASEEAIDTFTSAFLSANPNTDLSSVWNDTWEAFKVGGALGGVTNVASSALITPDVKENAPLAAQAALDTAPQGGSVTGLDGKEIPVTEPAEVGPNGIPLVPQPRPADAEEPAVEAPDAEDLQPVQNRIDAERLFADGKSLFAVDEQTGEIAPITSAEMLANYTPDQIGWTEPTTPQTDATTTGNQQQDNQQQYPPTGQGGTPAETGSGDRTVQGGAQQEAQTGGRTLSREELKSTFDLTDDQAEVAEQIARAMGLTPEQVLLGRETPKAAKAKETVVPKSNISAPERTINWRLGSLAPNAKNAYEVPVGVSDPQVEENTSQEKAAFISQGSSGMPETTSNHLASIKAEQVPADARKVKSGDVIGKIGWHVMPDGQIMISSVSTQERARRQGIGSRLVETVIEWRDKNAPSANIFFSNPTIDGEALQESFGDRLKASAPAKVPRRPSITLDAGRNVGTSVGERLRTPKPAQPESELTQPDLLDVPRQRSLSTMRAEIIRKMDELEAEPPKGDGEAQARRGERLQAALGRIERQMMPDVVKDASRSMDRARQKIAEDGKRFVRGSAENVSKINEEAKNSVESKITEADRVYPYIDPFTGEVSGGFITEEVAAMSQSLRRRAVEGDRITPEEAKQLWNETAVIEYASRQELNSANIRTGNDWSEILKDAEPRVWGAQSNRRGLEGYPELYFDRGFNDEYMTGQEFTSRLGIPLPQEKTVWQVLGTAAPTTGAPAPKPLRKSFPKDLEKLATSPTREGIENAIAQFYGGERKTLVPIEGRDGYYNVVGGKGVLGTVVVETTRGFAFGTEPAPKDRKLPTLDEAAKALSSAYPFKGINNSSEENKFITKARAAMQKLGVSKYLFDSALGGLRTKLARSSGGRMWRLNDRNLLFALQDYGAFETPPPAAEPTPSPAAEPTPPWENTGFDIPKSLRNANDWSLWEMDEQLEKAKQPTRFTDAIIGQTNSRGVEFTPETVMSELIAAEEAAKSMDGRFMSGNTRGASKRELVDSWVKSERLKVLIQQSRESNPEVWQAYDARQAQIQSLNVGDTVLTPYTNPENPQGSPAKVIRKFAKNWRVEMDGREMLLSPSVLRPAPTQAAAPTETNEDSITVTEQPDGSFLIDGRLGRQLGDRWVVQSDENRQKESRGERQIGGDRIFQSREEAIAETRKDILIDRANEESRKAAQAKEAEQSRIQQEKDAPLNAYLDTRKLSAMQRGKLKTTLSEPSNKRDSSSGKVYSGNRFTVIREMVADGHRPDTAEVPRIQELSRGRSNRMSNEEQRTFERRKAEAGTKTEYRISKGDTYFPVTKAEYELAQWAVENPAAPQQTVLPARSILSERAVKLRIEDNDPVPSDAVDTYGTTLPEGYVREGELYVYRPAPTPTTPPSQDTPAAPSDPAATRSRRLERMFGPNFERMFNELQASVRRDDPPYLQEATRESLNMLLRVRGFGEISESLVYGKRILDDMLAGKPNVVDKVLLLQDVPAAELKRTYTRPSAITAYGYELEGKTYTHPKKTAPAPTQAAAPARSILQQAIDEVKSSGSEVSIPIAKELDAQQMQRAMGMAAEAGVRIYFDRMRVLLTPLPRESVPTTPPPQSTPAATMLAEGAAKIGKVISVNDVANTAVIEVDGVRGTYQGDLNGENWKKLAEAGTPEIAAAVKQAMQTPDASVAAVNYKYGIEPGSPADTEIAIAILEGDLSGRKPPMAKMLAVPAGTAVRPQPIPKTIRAADITTEKGVIDALGEIASDDTTRYILNSVYFDAESQVAVATDGRRIIVLPTEIKGETRALAARDLKTPKGKTVTNPKGSKLDGNYPRWQQVIPNFSKTRTTKETYNLADLAAKVRGASRVFDFAMVKTAIAEMTQGDLTLTLDPELLTGILEAFQRTGAKSVTIEVASLEEPMLLTADNGAYAVLMLKRDNEGRLRSVITGADQEVRLQTPPDDDRTARFNELTDSLYQGRDSVTQEEIDLWKEENPEAWDELSQMREGVLREGGWDSPTVFRGDFPDKTTFTGREDRSNLNQGNVIFSSDPEIAKWYIRNEGIRYNDKMMTDASRFKTSDGLYSVKLKLGRSLEIDAKGNDWSDIDTPEVLGGGGSQSIDFLATEARNAGWDSLVVRNVEDERGLGDQFFTFSPEQIKSADPISAGPKITPDQWGDMGSGDIRYQSDLTAEDEAYLAAVEQGDMETAQRMVDEAARAAGYVAKAYHGSSESNLTRFDPSKIKTQEAGPGFYFTSDKGLAENYAEKSGGKVYAVFLKQSNPLITEVEYPSSPANNKKVFKDTLEGIARNAKLSAFERETMLKSFEKTTDGGSPNLLSNPAYFQDHLRKFIDSPSFSTLNNQSQASVSTIYNAIRGQFGREATLNTIWLITSRDGMVFDRSGVFTVLRSNQIKSAEPVTRDDQGNIIPPSQRFNPESDDIRYQSFDELPEVSKKRASVEASVILLQNLIDAKYESGNTRGVEKMEARLEEMLENLETDLEGLDETGDEDRVAQDAVKSQQAEFDSANPSPEEQLIMNWYRWNGVGLPDYSAELKEDYKTFGAYVRGSQGDVLGKVKDVGIIGADITDQQIEDAARESAAFYEARRQRLLGPKDFSIRFQKSVTDRSPSIRNAAIDYREGRLTQEEYLAIVKAESPARLFTEVPSPATPDDLQKVDKGKRPKIGAADSLAEGTRVGLRLDIPALRDHGVGVVTIHKPRGSVDKGTAGSPIGYGSVARVRNVRFATNSTEALNIAVGEAKQPLATVEGEWVPTTPEAAFQAANEAMTDPAWVQVGMNPIKHSWFYDRADMRPVISAEEVIQVGSAVFAKNPVYASPTDPRFMTKEGVRFQFAGERANIPQFMRDSLETAKAMAAEGKASEDIRAITGWFPSPYDGKMRWEIPDDGASLKPDFGKAKTVSDLIDHPALFEAYPSIAGVSVEFRGFTAGITEDGKTLVLPSITAGFRKDNAALLGGVLHETQHLVQAIEGFARGGTPEMAYEPERRRIAQKQAMLEKSRDEAKAAYDANRSDANLAAWKASVDAVWEVMGEKPAKLPRESEMAYYHRIAGEIESRDIEARVKYTPEQRAAIAPYSSENIAPEMAIILYQSRPQGAKGSAQRLKDGRVLLKGLQNPDFTTAVHEMAHAFEMTEYTGLTDDEVATLKNWAGDKNPNDRKMMAPKASEKFARGWERYLAEGKVPFAELQAVFDKIAKWMLDTYKTLTARQLNVDITPEVRAIFDKIAARMVAPSTIVSATDIQMTTEDGTPLPPAIDPTSDTPIETLDDVAGVVRHALENPLPPPPELTTGDEPLPYSLQRARADQEAALYGFDTAAWNQAARTFGMLWDQVTSEPAGTGEAALDKLLMSAEPDRPLTDIEVARFTHEGLKRKMVLDRTLQELQTAISNGNADMVEEKQKLVDQASARYQTMHNQIARSRTAAGRALNAWKYALKEDFSQTTLYSRALTHLNGVRIADNKAPLDSLPAAEAQAVAQFAERMAKMQQEIDALKEAQQMGADRAAEQQAMIEALKAERDAARATGSTKVQDATRKILVDKVRKAAKEARERLGLPPAEDTDIRFQSAPDTDPTWRDRVLVLAEVLIANPAMSAAQFADRVRKMFGDVYAAVADRLRSDVDEYLRPMLEDLTGKEIPTPAKVLESIDGSEELTEEMVYDLAKAHVYEGARNTEVLDRVFADLAEFYPDLTREDVAQLFTRYGETRKLSVLEEAKALRAARSLELVQRQIDDLEARGVMQRTGTKKDDPSDALRALRKKRDDLAKSLGYVPRDPETQLSSAQTAAKKRMANEIRDLEAAIASGTPRVRVRRGVEYTPEMQETKAKLDAMRKAYADTFGQERTPEERMKAVIRDLDRRIALERDYINRGIVKEADSPVTPIDSPEISARRELLKSLKEQKFAAYDALYPNKRALEQAMKDAEDALKRRQKLVGEGLKPAKDKPKRGEGVVATAELTSLWEAADELDVLLREMRKNRPLTPAQHLAQLERAYDSALRTREVLRKRIAENDLTPDTKVRPTPEERTRLARIENEELRKQLLQMQKDAGIGAFAYEAREAKKVAALEKSIEELRRKRNEKDFSKRKVTEPVTSERIRQLELEKDEAKRKYEEDRAREAFKTLGWTKQKLETAMAIWHARQMFNLSGDFGVLGRQLGKLRTFAMWEDAKTVLRRLRKGEPINFADSTIIGKSLSSAFQVFMNPEVRNSIYSEMATHPRYAFHKRNGFTLTSPHDTSHEINSDGRVRVNPMTIFSNKVIAAMMVFKGTVKTLAAVKLAMFTGAPVWNTALKGAWEALYGTALGVGGAAFARRVEYAQQTMLNVARWNMLEAALLLGGNVDPSENPEYNRQVTEAVMTLTGKVSGKGGISKWIKDNSYTLGLFWQFPQYKVSNLQSVAGVPLFRALFNMNQGGKLRPEATKAISMLYGHMVVGNAARIAIWAMLLGVWDDEDKESEFGVVMNPKHPHFLKLKMGRTFIDFIPGMSTWITDLSKAFRDTNLDRNALQAGYVVEKKATSYDKKKLLGEFLSKQLQANWKTLWQVGVEGQFYQGGELNRMDYLNKMDVIVGEIIMNLTVRDIQKLYETNDPATASVLAGLLLTGQNIAVRETAAEESKREAEERKRYTVDPRTGESLPPRR